MEGIILTNQLKKDDLMVIIPINRVEQMQVWLHPGEGCEAPEGMTKEHLLGPQGNIKILLRKGSIGLSEWKTEEVSSNKEFMTKLNEKVAPTEEEEEVEEFECEQCDQTFTSRRGLSSHMRVHNDDEENED